MPVVERVLGRVWRGARAPGEACEGGAGRGAMGERGGGDIPLLAAGGGGSGGGGGIEAGGGGAAGGASAARWSSVRVRGSTKSLVRLEPCNGLGAQLPLNGLLSPGAPAAAIGKEVIRYCRPKTFFQSFFYFCQSNFVLI